MFFKQVWRNAVRNRKGNGLFFASLVIAIVAFYTLLSLGEQDVMRFLATIESDAVRKLMMLLPVVYGVSLFFVFFLVYFACKYQLGSRRREFGMYQMLGMRRSRLFGMLFCETLCISLLALLIGLPTALFLTEIISLTTAKVVGLGILSHKFTFSLSAMGWTMGGFVAVQLLSVLLLCLPIGRAEPAALLHHAPAPKRRSGGIGRFFAGVVLLLAAYALGILRLKALELGAQTLMVVCGILGTFLLYDGLGDFLDRRIRKKSMDRVGLDVFTDRQVQENVLGEHKTLAVASLLLLLAAACISFGISMSTTRGTETRSTDFSIMGRPEVIAEVLEDSQVQERTKAAYPVFLSRIEEPEIAQLRQALAAVAGAENRAEYFHVDYAISLESYNSMLRAMGKAPIALEPGELALFSSIRTDSLYHLMDEALKTGTGVTVAGEEYRLLPQLYYDNIVADRAITLYAALIVPDDLFARIAVHQEVFCWNLQLTDGEVASKGLLQAIVDMEAILASADLEDYESYLGGIGRNLFYTVAASYLTIYLGVLFVVIADTMIGTKYLINLRQNRRRYVTLKALGAGEEAVRASVRRQIRSFFLLALLVAMCSSVAAILSMFTLTTGFLSDGSLEKALVLSAVALAVFAGAQVGYIAVVQRMGCREVEALGKL